MNSEGYSETDRRQQRREFRAVVEGKKRFASSQDVLGMFVAALSGVFGQDVLPSTLQPFAPCSTSSSSCGANVDVLLIESVQEALLCRIVVDWVDAVDATQLDDLVDLCIFGPPALTQQGLVQQCALRTLSRLLSSANNHPSTSERLVSLCTRALTRLSLKSLIAAAKSHPNPARSDVVWSETLRLVTSIPERLANATKGTSALTSHMWLHHVMVRGLVHCLSLDNADLTRLRDVLVRLDRLGYLARAIDEQECGFWLAFLRSSIEHREATPKWAGLRQGVHRDLRVKLDLRLVETLQWLVAKKENGVVELVTMHERRSKGSEGTMFLGKRSQETVAAIAHILVVLLGQPADSEVESASDSGLGTDEDEDDDDHFDSRVVSTFCTIALSPIDQSPLLAWSWCRYLWRCTPASLLHCLEMTLSVWADSTRVQRSTMQQQAFLSTLIVCLLSCITWCASSEHADDETATKLFAIARSGSVLNGVSIHLEHSDPAMRRSGMLIAEVLSAKTISVGGKSLNFGSGIWNGSGGWREEARVLRALSDAWIVHERAIEVIEGAWKGDDFSQALQVVGVGTKEADEDKVVVQKAKQGKQVAMMWTKSKPTTRRLPERVGTPSRSGTGKGVTVRPLITMIGSDDDDDGLINADQGLRDTTQTSTRVPLLKMFSSSQSTRTDMASGCNSSTDDSDSDAASDDSDSHSIHRIAASLSGLSTDEVSSVLNSQSAHSRQARRSERQSDAADLTHDPESHAAQFTSKIPIPVYVSQLSPLLRSSTRAQIRLALHHAAALIRRKSHTHVFGAEVRENAIDLTLSLVSLHDNFGIRGFEAMRRQALVELATADAQVVVTVLVEQCVGAQYSDVQRTAMWAAIAQSAVRLAGGQNDVCGEQIHVSADKVVASVIDRARQVGEQSVPQLRREKQLSVTPSSSATKWVQPLDLQNAVTLRSAAEDSKQEWTRLAGPTYLFPLLNRLVAYQTYHSSLSTTSYRGAGTCSLFNTTTYSLLLDTLTLLVSLSPTHVVVQATPLLLELLSSLTHDTGSVQTASALALLATTLDRSLESSDADRSFLQDQPSMHSLRRLLEHAHAVFASQNRASAMHPATANSGLQSSIVARAAAVLLLIDRFDSRRHDELRRLIGFAPA